MLRTILASAALAASVTAAGGATIEPGKIYIADYNFTGSTPQAASCCPVISLDGPIQAQQYNIVFGTDRFDVGESIRLMFDLTEPPEMPLADDDPALSTADGTSLGNSLSLGISDTFDNLSRGNVLIEALGGSFDIDSIEIFGSIPATVDAQGSPLATSLGIGAFLTDYREIGATEPPPPPDGVVPLPAGLPLLLSGLAGLGVLARRKKG